MKNNMLKMIITMAIIMMVGCNESKNATTPAVDEVVGETANAEVMEFINERKETINKLRVLKNMRDHTLEELKDSNWMKHAYLKNNPTLNPKFNRILIDICFPYMARRAVAANSAMFDKDRTINECMNQYGYIIVGRYDKPKTPFSIITGENLISVDIPELEGSEVDNTLKERPEGGIKEAMDFCKNEGDVAFCMARMGYE